MKRSKNKSGQGGANQGDAFFRFVLEIYFAFSPARQISGGHNYSGGKKADYGRFVPHIFRVLWSGDFSLS
jgi:hypothetical protein